MEEDTVATRSEQVEAAMRYAAALHANQKRKGSEVPYFTHLVGTMEIAEEHGADETELAAAVLHDAVEDHPRGGQTANEIREMFGPDVLAIVLGCSDSTSDKKGPWKERKEAYIKHASRASFSVALVSASDKLHNARSILQDHKEFGDAVFERFKAGKSATIWYYREVANALRRRAPLGLADRLDEAVAAMERL
jgi:(p)ppGpp synthase/HD superfamily hydrolase